MDWAASEWKQELSHFALQKVSSLEERLEKLQKERQQKQFQIESLELALDNQKRKNEEEKQQSISIKRDFQASCERYKELQNKCQRLQNDVQNREARITNLEGQLSQMKKKTCQLQQLEADIEELKSLKYSSEKQKLSSEKNVALQNDSISELQEKTKTFQTQLIKQEQLDRSGSTEETNILKQKIFEQETIIHELKSKLSDVTNFKQSHVFCTPSKSKENDPLKNLTPFANKSYGHWNEMNLTPSQINKRRDCSSDSTFSVNSEADEKVRKLEQLLKQMRQELDCQRHNSEAAKKAVEQKFKENENSLKADIKQQTQIISDLDKELKETRTKYQQDVSHANKKIDFITAQLNKVDSLKGYLENEVKTLNEKLNFISLSLIQKEDELKEIRKQKQNLEASKLTLQSQLSDSEGSKNILLQESQTLKAKIDSLHMKTEKDGFVLDKKEETLVCLKKELSEAKASNLQLGEVSKVEISTLNKSIAGLEVQLQTLKSQIIELNAAKQLLEEDMIKLRNERDGAVNKLCSINNENINLKQKMEDTKKSSVDLQADYESKLQSLTIQLASANSEAETNISFLTDLVSEIKAQNEKLKLQVNKQNAAKQLLEDDLEKLNEQKLEREQKLQVLANENSNLLLKLEGMVALKTECEAEVKEFKTNICSVNSESELVRDIKAQNEKLKSQVNKQNAVKQLLDDDIENLNQQKAEMEQKLQVLANENSNLLLKLESLVALKAECEAEVKELNTKLCSINSESELVSEIKAQNEKLKSQVNKQNAVKQLLDDDIENLNQQKAEMEQKLQVLANENSNLLLKLESLVALKAECEAEVKELNTKLCSINSESELVSEIKAQNEKLKLQVNEQDAVKQVLDDDIEKLNKQKVQTEQKLHLLTYENNNLQLKLQCLDTLQAEHESVVTELNTKLCSIDCESELVNEIKAQNKKLQSQVYNINASKQLLEDDIDKLKKHTAHLEQKVDVLTNENNNLLLKLENMDALLVAEKKELNAKLCSVNSESEQQISTLNKSIADMEAQTESLKSEISDHTVAKQLLEEKIEQLSSEKNEMEIKFHSLYSANCDLQQTLQSVKSSAADLQSKYESKLGDTGCELKSTNDSEMAIMLQQSVAELEVDYKLLRTQINENAVAKKLLEDELKLLSKEKSDIEIQLDLVMVENAEMKQKLKTINDLQEEYDSKFEDMNCQFNSSNEKAEMIISDLDKSFAEIMTETETLKSETYEQQSARELLEEEIEKLIKEKNETEYELTMTRVFMDDLQKKYEKAQRLNSQHTSTKNSDKKIPNWDRRITGVVIQNESLKSEVDKYLLEKKSFEKDVKKLSIERNKFESELSKLKKSNKELKQQLESKVNTLKSLEIQYEPILKINSQLLSENEELKKKIVKLTNSTTRMGTKIEFLKAEISKQNAAAELLKAIAKLNLEKIGMDDELNSIKQSSQNFQLELKSIKQFMNDVQEKYESNLELFKMQLISSSDEYEENISALKRLITGMEAQNSILISEVKGQNLTERAFKDKFENLLKEKCEVELQMCALKGNYFKLEEKLSSTEISNKNLRDECEKLKASSSHLLSMNNKLEVEISELNSFFTEKERLGGQMTQEQADEHSFDNFKNLCKEKHELENQLCMLKTENSDLLLQLENSRKTKDELELQFQKLGIELECAHKEIGVIPDLHKEIAETTMEIEALKTQVDEQLASKQQLDDDYEKLFQEKSEIENLLTGAKNENNELKSELEKSKLKMSDLVWEFQSKAFEFDTRLTIAKKKSDEKLEKLNVTVERCEHFCESLKVQQMKDDANKSLNGETETIKVDNVEITCCEKNLSDISIHVENTQRCNEVLSQMLKKIQKELIALKGLIINIGEDLNANEHSPGWSSLLIALESIINTNVDNVEKELLEFISTEKSLIETIQILEHQQDDMESDLDENCKEIEALKNKIKIYEDEISDYKVKANSFRNSEVSKTITTLKKANEMLNLTIEKIEEDLQESFQKNQMLEDKLRQYINFIPAVELQTDEPMSDLKSNVSRIAENSNIEIKESTENNDDSVYHKAKLDENKLGLQEEVSSLSLQISEVNNQKTDLEQRLAVQTSKLFEKIQDYENAVKHNEAYKEQIMMLQDEVIELQTRGEVHNQLMEKSDVTILQLEREICDLKIKISENVEILENQDTESELQGEMLLLKQTISESESKAMDLETKLTHREMKLLESIRENQDLINQCEDYKREVTDFTSKTVSLENDISTLSQQLSEAENKAVDLEAKLVHQETKYVEMVRENEIVTKKYEGYRKEFTEITSKNLSLENEILKLVQQLSEAESKKADLEAKLAQEKRLVEMSKENAVVMKDYENYMKEISELSSKNASLESEILELAQKLSEAVSKTVDLETELHHQEIKFVERARENEDVLKQYENCKVEVTELSSKNASLESEILKLADVLNEYENGKREISELTSKNVGLENEVSNIVQHLSEAKSQYSKLELKLSEVESLNSKLELKLSEVESQNSKLELKLSEVESQNSKLELKLSEVESLNSKLELKLSDETSYLQQKLLEKELILKENSNYKNQIKKFEVVKRELQIEIENCKSTSEEHNFTVFQLKDEIKLLRTKVENYESQFENLDVEKSCLRKENLTLKQTVDDTGRQLKRLETMLNEEKSIVQEMIDENNITLKEIENFKGQIVELSSKKLNLENEIILFKQNAIDLKSEKNELEIKLNEQLLILQEKLKEIEQLESEKSKLQVSAEVCKKAAESNNFKVTQLRQEVSILKTKVSESKESCETKTICPNKNELQNNEVMLKQKLFDIEVKEKDLKVKLAEKVSELQENTTKHKCEVGAANAKICKLQAEVQILRDALDENNVFSAKLKGTTLESETFKTELECAIKNYEDCKMELNAMSVEKLKLQKEVTLLKETMLESETSKTELECAIKNYEDCKMELNSMSVEKLKLQKEVTLLKEKISDAEGLKQVEKEFQSHSLVLQENESSKKEHQIKLLQNQLVALESEISVLKESNTSLSSESSAILENMKLAEKQFEETGHDFRNTIKALQLKLNETNIRLENELSVKNLLSMETSESRPNKDSHTCEVQTSVDYGNLLTDNQNLEIVTNNLKSQLKAKESELEQVLQALSNYKTCGLRAVEVLLKICESLNERTPEDELKNISSKIRSLESQWLQDRDVFQSGLNFEFNKEVECLQTYFIRKIKEKQELERTMHGVLVSIRLEIEELHKLYQSNPCAESEHNMTEVADTVDISSLIFQSHRQDRNLNNFHSQSVLEELESNECLLSELSINLKLLLSQKEEQINTVSKNERLSIEAYEKQIEDLQKSMKDKITLTNFNYKRLSKNYMELQLRYSKLQEELKVHEQTKNISLVLQEKLERAEEKLQKNGAFESYVKELHEKLQSAEQEREQSQLEVKDTWVKVGKLSRELRETKKRCEALESYLLQLQRQMKSFDLVNMECGDAKEETVTVRDCADDTKENRQNVELSHVAKIQGEVVRNTLGHLPVVPPEVLRTKADLNYEKQVKH